MDSLGIELLHTLLDGIAECNPEFRDLGIAVFIEGTLSWYKDFIVLIHVGAIDTRSFDCVTEKAEEMGFIWGVVTRGDGQYITLHPPGEHPALLRSELHTWFEQG